MDAGKQQSDLRTKVSREYQSMDINLIKSGDLRSEVDKNSAKVTANENNLDTDKYPKA